MDLNNQKLKICKLDSNSSKAKKIENIFLSNPNVVFDVPTMAQLYNGTYRDNLINISVSTIITRLYAKNKLIRTPNQLNLGYIYSVSNKQKLDEIHRDHLLPYEFDDNERILELITQNKFEKLKTDIKLNFPKIGDFDFIKKYDLNYFNKLPTQLFLTELVAFIMGDGHIAKNLQKTIFFFKELKDAELFSKDFKSIFHKESLVVEKGSYCYRARLNSKGFCILLNYLGAPIGNKVFGEFLIPNWVVNGPTEIKKAFLFTFYGNEGSKPQDNRWRIQFVLSKTKKHVENLLILLNQIRTMLFHFGITTSHIQLRKQKGRQFCGRFYIKGKDNILKFYNKLGFAYASEKQEVLESLLRRDNLIN